MALLRNRTVMLSTTDKPASSSAMSQITPEIFIIIDRGFRHNSKPNSNKSPITIALALWLFRYSLTLFQNNGITDLRVYIIKQIQNFLNLLIITVWRCNRITKGSSGVRAHGLFHPSLINRPHSVSQLHKSVGNNGLIVGGSCGHLHRSLSGRNQYLKI